MGLQAQVGMYNSCLYVVFDWALLVHVQNWTISRLCFHVDDRREHNLVSVEFQHVPQEVPECLVYIRQCNLRAKRVFALHVVNLTTERERCMYPALRPCQAVLVLFLCGIVLWSSDITHDSGFPATVWRHAQFLASYLTQFLAFSVSCFIPYSRMVPHQACSQALTA